MVEAIQEMLAAAGVAGDNLGWLSPTLALATILVLSAGAYFVAKFVLLRLITALTRHTGTIWDDKLVEHRVFFWLAHLAPAIVIYMLAPETLADYEQAASIVAGTALAYMIVVGALSVDALLNAILAIYQTYDVSRTVPLKSFFQVAKILLYLIVLILIVALIVGKSPAYLLGSMGILASVLMLVFKDAILGFVGGIQLAANRMLAKGDWIEMPSHQADGDVIDIALTTVKVQNWDKTITTIPTYALISSPFKNWRGMSESGGRRIKRAISIDLNTITLCTPEMIERFATIRYIAEYIERMRGEIARWNTEHGVDMSDPVNARRLTNIGTFRAYVLAYLRNHPEINQDMTLLVRQLQPGPEGLPLEIYCFAADKRWAEYERIQADIFDHIVAVAPQFDLRVFQNPTGSDFRVLSARSSDDHRRRQTAGS